MTGHEHQAKQIIAELIVHGYIKTLHIPLPLSLYLAAQLFVLPLDPMVAAQVVDRPVFRGDHQPGARVLRYTRFRPLRKGRNEGVLSQFLGDTHVAHDPGDTRYDSGGFHPPDCVYRPVDIGSRHSYQSHHLYVSRRKKAGFGSYYRVPDCFCNSGNPAATS
jgi:hypothetical protein